MTHPRPSGDHPADRTLAALNPRDLEVVLHLAAGGSTADIASTLSVTGNTARTRIRRLQRKLGVPDRAAVVRVAREQILVGDRQLCSCG